jgi:hypothetical protein
MTLDRYDTATSLIDVLDRVLDKGIVIDAWVRVSIVGIDLITVEARVVVASIQTYLQYADAIAVRPSSAPAAPAVAIKGAARQPRQPRRSSRPSRKTAGR